MFDNLAEQSQRFLRVITTQIVHLSYDLLGILRKELVEEEVAIELVGLSKMG